MTALTRKIISDLSAGPSCADSLAQRVGITANHAESELAILAEQRKVETYPLESDPRYTVWRIR